MAAVACVDVEGMRGLLAEGMAGDGVPYDGIAGDGFPYDEIAGEGIPYEGVCDGRGGLTGAGSSS